MGRVYLGVHEGRYATGGCPDLHRRASMIGLTTTTCTGSASQRWTRI
ncbi:hypothetical protein [Streptomyces pactum]|nr:hypothetical protein [Streptomyces pactum]